MHVVYQPNVCRVVGNITAEERQVLDAALNFEHPNPTAQQLNNPYWDQKVNFWLDSYKTQFPTGLWPHVWNMLHSHGQTNVHVECGIGQATSTVEVDPHVFQSAGIELRDYQIDLANKAIAGNRGVISAPPRSGKTLIQAAIAATLDKKTVIFVQRQSLLKQHYNTLKSLGLDVGLVQGQTREFDKKICIAMLQTVWSGQRSAEMMQWLNSVEVMLIDECHHSGSGDTFYRAGLLCPASWRLGFSGTPYSITDLEEQRFSEDHWKLAGLLGPQLGDISLASLQDKGLLVKVNVVQVKQEEDPEIQCLDGHVWHPVYKAGVVENKARNQCIQDLALDMVGKGYFPLILINQVKHGEALFKSLSRAGLRPIFARGGSKVLTASGMMQGSINDAYELVLSGGGNLLIATQIGDEGVDLPKVDGLILAVGGKADKVNVQRAFRPLTSAEGKTRAVVVDFDDRQHGVLRRQSAARRKIYKSLGFEPKLATMNQALDLIPANV